MTNFTGSGGNDTFTGTSGSDYFDMSQGGDDTVSGLAGHDNFDFGTTLTSADRIDGGGGDDTVFVSGNYKSSLGNAIQLGSPVFTSIEQLDVLLRNQASDHVDVVAGDNAVAAGQTFNFYINTSGDAGGGAVTFDGSAETDGRFHVTIDGLSHGDFAFTGGAGDDFVDVGSFDHGTMILAGGGGNDFFSWDAGFSPQTVHFDGGSGFDTLLITDTVQPTPVDIKNIEQITLGEQYFQFTIDNATVAAGKSLIVDFSSMTSATQYHGYDSFFDASAESDGHLAFVAGSGIVTLDGGAQSDSFDLTRGGLITARGNGGNDSFSTGSAFSGAMQIDGGAGNDTLSLNGDYARGIDLDNVTNIETLKLGALSDYNISVDDMTVAAKTTFHVLASGMLAGDSLVFDGSAELNGRFDIHAGAGDDTLTGGKRVDVIDGGAGNDTIDGGIGNDILKGGAGDDVITGGRGADAIDLGGGVDLGGGYDRLVYRDSDSRPSAPDVVTGFVSGSDRLDLHYIDADTTQIHNQAFHLGGSAFTNTPGELIQYQDAHNHTVIAGDVNGDGSADIQILLVGSLTLTTGDFVL